MFRSALGAGALSGALLGALLSASATTSAQAADMPFFNGDTATPPVNEGPVEWGSNWYLRGDFGVAKTTPTTLNGVALSPDFPNNWTIGLGGGYKFNNWFRGDVTVDYESLYSRNGVQPSAALPCVVGLNPVLNGAGTIIGSSPVIQSCYPNVRNRTESMLVLANAYLDLGNWYGITPYVGAGAGLNVLYQHAAMTWYMGNGLPFAGLTFTDPFSGATYLQNLDSKFEGTHLRFAYAFMGGLAYDIDNHWKVDVGYRYTNLGKITGVDQYNTPISKDLTSHQVRIGFRYVID